MSKSHKIEPILDFIRQQLRTANKTHLIVGISGGVDSALCLKLAAMSIDPKAVIPVFLPHLPGHSIDKKKIEYLCASLKVELREHDISVHVKKIMEELDEDRVMSIGNFAARLRMAYLYEIAYKLNALVINTSNKTEIMTGYCTKWGDQTGDISPIGHLYKHEVYELATQLNLPAEIIEAPASAGFFTGQTDESEMGISYFELDKALLAIEENRRADISPETFKLVNDLMQKAYHKRSLAPVLES